MSVELDKIKAEMAFYAEVGPLEEELEAAREVKADDPVRWAEAKQAFEEQRRFYREAAQSAPAEAGTIVVDAVEVGADAIEVGGDK